jgi:hypothetical protein
METSEVKRRGRPRICLSEEDRKNRRTEYMINYYKEHKEHMDDISRRRREREKELIRIGKLAIQSGEAKDTSQTVPGQ